MANLTFPKDDPLFGLAAFAWGSTNAVRSSGASPVSDSEQLTSVPYSHRWTAQVTIRRARTFAERAKVEATIDRWADPLNRVVLPHLAHLTPYGTMRGAPVLAGAHAQGTRTLNITCDAGSTVDAGTMLGVTTTASYPIQVVRVAVGGTANGSGALSLTSGQPLRAAANSGAAVVWDMPSALFRLRSWEMRASFIPGEMEQIVLDFVEVTS